MHSQPDGPVCSGTTSNTWNPHIHWQGMAPVKFNERFTGKRIDGENVMIVFTEATTGFSVPTHCHESEQITMVQSGSWLFNVAGREFTAKAGDVVHIPAGWEHSAMALENSVAIEVFTPPRSEWEDEADQYLWGV